MREALQRAWLGRGPLARALWPLSLLLGALASVRRLAYRRGWLGAWRAPVPVVVVGNVVAGGAGKTPLVIALVEHFASHGVAVGVVSRGYGRRDGQVREVHAGSDPADTGDEPLLVKQRTGAPVFVGARRAEAARALLAAHPQVRLLVSDDGLQHLALARDVEICVFDARGAGNGWLLPAGPLREPWPRPVDLVVTHGDPPGIAGFRARRRLAGWARQADGRQESLRVLNGRQPVKALAAIAQPEVFFAMLRAEGLQLAACEALADHDPLNAPRPPGEQGQTLLCTEKDAAKLWRQRPDAWAVPLQLELEPAFWQALEARVRPRL